MAPPKNPKPITFTLTPEQIEKIETYTKTGRLMVAAKVVDGKLVLENVLMDGEFCPINRCSDEPHD